jgi:glycosyltransferase involved in cell wall biosynthesis
MRKRKVLFVTEAHFHPTGYGVYTYEVLSRLSKHPQLEVAELACFIGPETSEINAAPWKVYPNVPDDKDKQAMDIYNATMSNKFGEFSFNNVLLDFQPDFVMDIRDWWMLEFEERSPFRDFFNLAIMPTVDAEPQNPQWIDTYSNADGVFAYSEFGRDTMLNQSNKINFIDIASPCASDKFFQLDKEKTRAEFGLDKNAIIFGTVMRNQRRKLYPDLLKAFKLFLDNIGHPDNVYLYLHTAYPDVGWDIPQLIIDNDLSGRVIITYKCKSCGDITVSFFNEAVKFCNKCKQMSSSIVGINNKMEDVDLNKIYNLFDVYIQWANSEGWGMPQLEAAYAGLPIISVDYSAMSSLVHNINGIPIKPIGFYKELETGCMRAVPDNENLATQMECMLNKNFRDAVAQSCHDNARKIYNWDYTADKWLKYFLSQPLKDLSTTWLSPSRVFNPQTSIPDQVRNSSVVDQVNWLFSNVFGKPDLIYKSVWRRVVKDLIYRAGLSSSIPGYYYNDFAHPDIERRYEEFNLDKAMEIFLNMRLAINQWEQARIQRLGIK